MNRHFMYIHFIDRFIVVCEKHLATMAVAYVLKQCTT